jgi:hypothetical protein
MQKFFFKEKQNMVLIIIIIFNICIKKIFNKITDLSLSLFFIRFYTGVSCRIINFLLKNQKKLIQNFTNQHKF